MMAGKDDFKRGCESGGGSFVENADGTYQCNTASGLVIKCRSDGQRCWIAAHIADGLDLQVDVGHASSESFEFPITRGIRLRF